MRERELAGFKPGTTVNVFAADTFTSDGKPEIRKKAGAAGSVVLDDLEPGEYIATGTNALGHECEVHFYQEAVS